MVNDDIVTRLRQALETDESILLTMPRPTVQMMADEIERLRKLTSELAQLMMPFAMLMTNEEQEKVMRAVRGD